MLDKSQYRRNLDILPDVAKVNVRACNSCEQTLFQITSDNRILCCTCCKYVHGWHAIGSVMSS